MELNEQTLEQILTRQRERHQRFLDDLAKNSREHSDERAQESYQYWQGFLKDSEAQTRRIVEIYRQTRQGLMATRELAAKVRKQEMVKTDASTGDPRLAAMWRDLKAKAGRDELAVLEARVAKLERTGRARP